MYCSQKESIHFGSKLFWSGGVSSLWGISIFGNQILQQNSRRLWTISSLHVKSLWQTVLIFPIHILFTKGINTFYLKKSDNKSWWSSWLYQVFVCKNVPISHTVYYWCALKAFLILHSKKFYFFFLHLLTSKKFTIFPSFWMPCNRH